MSRHRFIAPMFALCLALAALPAGADTQADQEAEIGRQFYAQLQQKGEIITDSPYYAILNPIAQQIKRVADPQYFFPFTFILVHEAQPNAFAVPGGNVYVTDSLMRFVRNREELAGVLCHETSHDIHHDVMNTMGKTKRAAGIASGVAILGTIVTGGRFGAVPSFLASKGFQAIYGGYTRPVETAADLKGADTCAQAGSNPWGMVWLFEQFQTAQKGGTMEMLSDHPTDSHRIDDLKRHFEQNPALFGRFDPAISSATPLEKVSAEIR